MKLADNNIFLQFCARIKKQTQYSDARNIPDMPCAYCGQNMLSRLDAENILKKITISNDDGIPNYRSAKVISHTMLGYQDCLDERLLNSLLLLRNQAACHPRRKLKTLFSAENFPKRIVQKQKRDQKKNFRFLNELNSVIDKHLKPDSENFTNMSIKRIRKKVVDIITKDRYSQETKLAILLDYFKSLPVTIEPDEFHRKTSNIIKNFLIAPPRFSFDFWKQSEEKIINIILDWSRATFEHIQPKTEGGKNGIGNGLYVCKHCNQSRASESLDSFLRRTPYAKQNIVRQYNFMVNQIREGNLTEKFSDYPETVKTQLKKCGFNIDKYNEALKNVPLQLLDLQKELENIQNSLYPQKKQELTNAVKQFRSAQNTYKQTILAKGVSKEEIQLAEKSMWQALNEKEIGYRQLYDLKDLARRTKMDLIELMLENNL